MSETLDEMVERVYASHEGGDPRGYVEAAILAERQRCFRMAMGVVNDWERGAKSTPEEKFAVAEGAKAARVVASRIHSGAHN